jgi:NAD-dependent dihydropyrimidine dehydrogenase PreA subunit
MQIIINHKICDQSPACGGIEVCPTKALYWDETSKKISYDENKCIGCGACENMCPIHAINLARTAEQEREVIAKIDSDQRRAEDLFVDRFGGDFVHTTETLSANAMTIIKRTAGLLILELNNEDLIHCLLNCIPLADVIGAPYTHIKVMNPDEELLKELGVSELPALILFRDGVKVGDVQGFFENSSDVEKVLLKSKIKKICDE